MEKKLKFKLTYYELLLLRDNLRKEIRENRQVAEAYEPARDFFTEHAGKLERILEKIEKAGGVYVA